MGAHPFHYRCLELYSCLTSACRVCAKTGGGCAALHRAALYGLMQSAAAEAMLAVGEGSSLHCCHIRHRQGLRDQPTPLCGATVCLKLECAKASACMKMFPCGAKGSM